MMMMKVRPRPLGGALGGSVLAGSGLASLASTCAVEGPAPGAGRTAGPAEGGAISAPAEKAMVMGGGAAGVGMAGASVGTGGASRDGMTGAAAGGGERTGWDRGLRAGEKEGTTVAGGALSSIGAGAAPAAGRASPGVGWGPHS